MQQKRSIQHSRIFKSQYQFTPSEYVKIMSGRADVFGIDGYTMEAPVVSHKIIGFSSPRRDVKKREYIYDLEKKAEGFVPSTKYTPSDPNGFLTDPKKIKFAQNREARVTLFEEIGKRKQWVPASNQYDSNRKIKVIGNYKMQVNLSHDHFGFSNDQPSGPLTEAQYLGTQTPCPTKYDQIKYEKYNGHERSPIYSSPRSKRFKPLEKSDLPSPTTYNILEDKKKSFKLAKAKNIRFVDEIIQRKKQIPGPQTYDTAKADRWISTGTGKSYK